MTVPIVPGTNSPRPRRGLLLSLLTAAVVLVAAGIGLGIVLAAGEPPAEPAAVTQATPSSTTPPPPAPVPTGARGSEWYSVNGTKPWAAHIVGVDAIGTWVIIGTDLGIADLDLAVEICRTGREYAALLKAPNASVSVYSPTRLALAESKSGSPCKAGV